MRRSNELRRLFFCPILGDKQTWLTHVVNLMSNSRIHGYNSEGRLVKNLLDQVEVHFGDAKPSEIVVPLDEWFRIYIELTPPSMERTKNGLSSLRNEIGQQLSLWLILKPWSIRKLRNDLQGRVGNILHSVWSERLALTQAKLTFGRIRQMLLLDQVRAFRYHCGKCGRYHDETQTFTFNCGWARYLCCINENVLLKEEHDVGLL